ncbi:hypothetical protein LENED_007245 [Lentinula edodes]|uniref:Uncharacterized protein n=1 Tax=Lentinula edodes TaxID=5353 RepID=A0A1Q3EDZ5_LENED|nr:hypothetical protein LENED_007245 [Lentinula edodes]
MMIECSREDWLSPFISLPPPSLTVYDFIDIEGTFIDASCLPEVKTAVSILEMFLGDTDGWRRRLTAREDDA